MFRTVIVKVCMFFKKQLFSYKALPSIRSNYCVEGRLVLFVKGAGRGKFKEYLLSFAIIN